MLILLTQVVFAQSFDFNSKGEKDANAILKKFVENNFYIDDVDTVAYFYDIFRDDKTVIIGIARSNIFYSLEGYKLIVLKEEEDGFKPVKCDVLFDNTQPLIFEKDRITYFKTIFYKNKKYSAHIKENEIKTIKTLNDKLTDRKVQSIEHLTQHSEGGSSNVLELTDFKTMPERKVKINYPNLDARVRNYLESR